MMFPPSLSYIAYFSNMNPRKQRESSVFSANLIFLNTGTKVCGIWSNNVLHPSFTGEQKTMPIACIVWGSPGNA